MAARNAVVDLRNLLAQRFPSTPPPPPARRLQTGLAFLDALLEGGFPQGALTELVAPQISAGSASLIHVLLGTAQNRRHFLALVDGRDSFDPSGLTNDCLRHLLWLRCHTAVEAIKAADLLLRDGNFPLIILDLVLNPIEELRKIPATTWYRLQRLVEPGSSVLLVLNRHSMVASAQLKLLLENRWTLSSLEEETAADRLRMRVQRSHLSALTSGS